MADEKPTCGTQAVSTDDTLNAILAVFGAIGGVISVVTGIGGAAGMMEVVVTLFGVGIPGGVALGAVAGGLGTLVIIGVFAYQRCAPQTGLRECAAGVADDVVDSFGSGWDYVFPFTAMHPRVDVVVKCDYWDLVSNNAQFVKCNDDSRSSPILQCFFHSDEVCGAVSGAIYGGAVGAVAGVIAGAVIGAAIGCATVILCLFALIVAAIVAAVAVIVGAAVGGNIVKAAVGDDPATSSSGQPVELGHYLSVNCNLLAFGDFDGAIVSWWVEGTTLHGKSNNGEGGGGGRPYPHTDPDTNLVNDACPGGNGGGGGDPTGGESPPPQEPPPGPPK